MKEKLLKIKTLAERGATKGEREAAQNRLEILCKKYNIKVDELKKMDDIEVRYGDGMVAQFKNDCQFGDHAFADGEIRRYFRDGRVQVIREAPAQVQVFTAFTSTSSTSTGFNYW